MRRSGKRALIQLQRGTDTPFDVSGLSTDGHSRANEFSFQIEANTAEALGYNESWTETVPTGQSKWIAALTVFYNCTPGEVNEYLWTMWGEQHDTAACADPQEYTLFIMPEGDCEGRERWTGARVVLKSLDFPLPHSNVMVIKLAFAGWTMTREIIEEEEPLEFPATSIIDDANRPDEGPPPSTSWTNINAGLKVVSNQFAGDSLIGGNASHHNTTFGPDCEAYVTIAVLPQVQSSGLAFGGISVGLKFSDSHKLTVTYTRISSTEVELSICDVASVVLSVVRTATAGDRIGIRSVGSIVYGYFCPTGGEWEIFGSIAHNHQMDSGYLTQVIHHDVSDARTDDFGGGTLPA